MGVLRKRLAEAAPELHEALERSWRIALEEWLPAVSKQSDSFNSYPHLRNLEEHLDQVVTGFETLPVSRGRLSLRPAELYVLMAAVLFHDFGKARESRDHGKGSHDSILNDYAHLGIPSRELARCIAKICWAHAPSRGFDEQELYDTVIDPYGEIRQRPLRALLVLGDHMDGAYTRVLPDYVKEAGQLDPVGLFRNAVRGVHADCEAQMVRVVLADMGMRPNAGEEPVPEEQVKYDFALENSADDRNQAGSRVPLQEWGLGLEDTDVLRAGRMKRKRAEEDQAEAHRHGGGGKQTRVDRPSNEWIGTFLRKRKAVRQRIAERLLQAIAPKQQTQPVRLRPLWSLLPGKGEWKKQPSKEQRACLEAWGLENFTHYLEETPLGHKLSLNEIFDGFAPPDWLVALGLFRARRIGAVSAPGERQPSWWPSPSMLAALMHDVGENAKALNSICEDLALIEVPLRGWLIEHREHLYTHLGHETYEPILDQDFLQRVVDGMWHLSLHIFGCASFTYEELASQVWEPDVTRVRKAVRRLAIIARGSASIEPETIWAGEGCWCWNRRRLRSTDSNQGESAREFIRSMVEALHPPWYERVQA
jgi:hypothetical protein